MWMMYLVIGVWVLFVLRLAWLGIQNENRSKR